MEKSHKVLAVVLLLLSVVALGLILATILPEDDNDGDHQQGTSTPIEDIYTVTPPIRKSHWPNTLRSQFPLFRSRPTNTQQAEEMGWVKGGDCVPELGTPWWFNGSLTPATSATLYYSPAISNSTPGVLTGLEVDFFGYVEPSLVGTYLSETKTTADGITYHSIEVAFQNYKRVNLCDTEAPLRATGVKYVSIAPQRINYQIPTEDTSSDLQTNWKEGSCIPQMGIHWIQDLVGGANLTKQAANLVPVVPMYDSYDGTLTAIFFVATEQKQTWAADCNLFAPSPQCVGQLNFWDMGPGLNQDYQDGLFLWWCNNFCDSCGSVDPTRDQEVSWTGSRDGVYQTMHWWFHEDPMNIGCKGSEEEEDGGPPGYFFCRNGDYANDYLGGDDNMVDPEDPPPITTTHSHWPNTLRSQFPLFRSRPTNTQEAEEMGWVKGGDCVPELGTPWWFNGSLTPATSATLYYSPAINNSTPGVLTGLEVDFFGYVEPSLVGTYLSETKTTADGTTYHSIEVAFQNYEEVNLCDTEAPLRATGVKYVSIAPQRINYQIPTKDTSSDLQTNWKEGSCIPQMGIHWIQDLVGGANLTKQAANLVPVVPMYDSYDGTMTALFFVATEQKQTWAADCNLFAPSPECVGQLNFWDMGPGLNQDYQDGQGLWWCNNFCDSCGSLDPTREQEVSWTGSQDGVYQTMHWWFHEDPMNIGCKGSEEEEDGGPPGSFFCRNGDYANDYIPN